MSKMLRTKSRIVSMLREKPHTMSQIAERLGLSPSTVSQHLKELEAQGTIEQVDNSFSTKWKYYALNDLPRGNKINDNKVMSMKNKIIVPVVAAVVVVALVAIGLAALGMRGQSRYTGMYLAPGSQLPKGATAFTVSDAPAVSSISAVNVSITNVSVHSATTGKWYTFTGSASYNLVALHNISALVAAANIPQGTYNEMVIQVSNASATINGSEQAAFLPSGKLIILVTFNVSGNTTNWFNLDFNLSKSVHVTGNGKVVLMPVINVESNLGYNVTANSNGTVSSSGHGNSRAVASEGMDVNGTMRAGFYVPQTESVSVNNNRVSVSVNTSNTPVVIVANGHLYLAVNTNLSAILSAGARAGSMIRCTSNSGAVQCNTDSSANTAESIPEILGISIGGTGSSASASGSGNASSGSPSSSASAGSGPSTKSGTSGNVSTSSNAQVSASGSASGSAGASAGGAAANVLSNTTVNGTTKIR